MLRSAKMPKFTITSLPISGYQDKPVPNTFFRQDGEAQHVAVVLPGIGYTADMPVLYYPATLLREAGADVLQVKYAYTLDPAFQRADDSERLRWLQADVAAAWQAVSEQRPYTRVSLVGKSLGTRAMALGGAFVALSDDPSGLYYNPAGICDTRRLNVSVSASPPVACRTSSSNAGS